MHVRVCDRVGFFFFKQKTAYEMRISDWSSDVCSSDLALCKALRDDRFGLGRGARKGKFDRRERQPVLGLEMMEKRALADTRLLGHGSGPKARKAARGNDFERRMRDALTHLLRPFALRTPLTFHAAVRNGITTSTNRSRFSICVQCPHSPNTCSSECEIGRAHV